MSQSPVTQALPDAADEGVVSIGWPAGLPCLRPERRSYPLYPPHQSRKILEVFVGPKLDVDQDESIKLTLDNYFQPGVKSQYDGLRLTTYRTSWPPERAKPLLQLVGERVTSYLELRVLDAVGGVDIMTVKDGEFGASVWASCIAGPADHLSKEKELKVIRSLPGLGVVHILPPSTSFDDTEKLETCVLGIKEILQCAPQMRKCILPLDIFTEIEDVLCAISKCETLEELELLAPISFDLHPFPPEDAPSIKADTAGAFFDSLCRGLATLSHIQTLAIPISLVTPELLICLSHMPDLLFLTIRPHSLINSVQHFLRAVEVAGITTQGGKSFSNLTFLDFEGYGPASPRPWEKADEHDDTEWARFVIQTILHKTVL